MEFKRHYYHNKNDNTHTLWFDLSGQTLMSDEVVLTLGDSQLTLKNPQTGNPLKWSDFRSGSVGCTTKDLYHLFAVDKLLIAAVQQLSTLIKWQHSLPS